MENYVLGIDFGTSSVRCVACRAENGEIAARAAADYPRWARGMYCFSDKEIYRQSPLDHLESLERAVKDCVSGLSPRSAGALSASPLMPPAPLRFP